jgi:WhiB family redox-sensing transcriptional regulator
VADPEIIVNPARWWEAAACRGIDQALFFPAQGEDPRPAKAVCATCPVQTYCLEDALTNKERFGIWAASQRRNAAPSAAPAAARS